VRVPALANGRRSGYQAGFNLYSRARDSDGSDSADSVASSRILNGRRILVSSASARQCRSRQVDTERSLGREEEGPGGRLQPGDMVFSPAAAVADRTRPRRRPRRARAAPRTRTGALAGGLTRTPCGQTEGFHDRVSIAAAAAAATAAVATHVRGLHPQHQPERSLDSTLSPPFSSLLPSLQASSQKADIGRRVRVSPSTAVWPSGRRPEAVSAAAAPCE
jgi:hypothetical protein